MTGARLQHRSCSGSRSGFTLIELLVVISIIALLIGILLPSLGAARSLAQQVVCSSNERQLAQAQLTYSLSNNDVLASPNTSNLRYLARQGGTVFARELEGSTTPTTPTSNRDWISPIIGDGAGFSSNRAERTANIFNDLACASSSFFNQDLFGLNTANDRDDFRRVNNERGFLQMSYLAPESMYSRADGELPTQVTVQPGGAFVQFYVTDNQADRPQPAIKRRPYIPALERVGVQASAKVMFADGTRFADLSALDFDVNPNPSSFGSFYDNNPIIHGSTAYGRQPFTASVNTPLNAQLSFRHNNGGMNVAYMDGHVAGISQTEAYTDPRPWWPGRSRWVGINATPEAKSFMEQIGRRASDGNIYID